MRWYADAYEIDLDPSLVKQLFVAPLVRRVANLMASRARAADWSHRGDAWFDWLAARHVAAIKPDVVVCYENAALETFRTARKIGIQTILDAASFHHTWQDRYLEPVESRKVHERIVRRKDAEIELADVVLTVSALAGRSYLEAGVPAEKMAAVPVGVDLSNFAPMNMKPANEPRWVRFVFVGSLNRLKGIDVLDDACRILTRQLRPYELTLIGKDRQSSVAVNAPHVTLLPRLPHTALAKELLKHDVLVLPSRFDSFGMVVAEGMACGLPAIVSENVGAKEMVTPEVNGKVVPAGDATSLAEAMSWFINHADRLPVMAAAARVSAEHYSWAEYRSRAIATLCEACGRLKSAPVAVTI
jgi:glycosyltransferase involved in cell wall biosynthesis